MNCEGETMKISLARRSSWAARRTLLRSVVVVLVPLASLVAGIVVVTSMYAPGDVLHALRHANVALVMFAFLLGAVIEALKAERATLMLARCRPIRFGETFGIQVVSLATKIVCRSSGTDRQMVVRSPCSDRVMQGASDRGTALQAMAVCCRWNAGLSGQPPGHQPDTDETGGKKPPRRPGQHECSPGRRKGP